MYINGRMQGLKHRLSIKECISRTQGSDTETVCVLLEWDFVGIWCTVILSESRIAHKHTFVPT